MDSIVTDFLKRATLFSVAILGSIGIATEAHAEWPEFVTQSFFEFGESDSAEAIATVYRGQSDPFYNPPATNPVAPPAGSVPVAQAAPNTFPQQPTFGDPFANGQFAPPPASFDPFGQQQQAVYGVNGPQPYRFGWKEQVEFATTPRQGTNPNVGRFGWNELNILKEWNGQGAAGGIWTFSPQYNGRFLDGPTFPGLSSNMHRIGLGMKYATPVLPNGGAFEFGFTPAIASDFKSGASSGAWQFDAHIASFWRTSPQWMWVLGALYWDRNEDIVLPYAGGVWTPNDYFEARLLFPKAKLEWFLGTPFNTATWFYVKGEYHVESFEVTFEAPGPIVPSSSVMQTEEWRLLGGLRWETGYVETYMEAGVVFDRKVDFGTAGRFEPDEAFMARFGMKF